MHAWNIIHVLSAFSVYNAAAQFMAPGRCQTFTCDKYCPMGYILDSNGCRTCHCSSRPGAPMRHPGGDPFHQGGANIGLPRPGSRVQFNTSPTYTNPCILNASCGISRCASGFYNGPGGCQFCICAPDMSSQSSYTNPCSDAPSTCDATCTNGYRTGRGGCQFCDCAVNTVGPLVTPTPAPALTTPAMSKEDECLTKITECQLKHPFGFMTDSTCEMCIGKDEIYRVSDIPEERQPMVRLANPCVMGFDVCRIFCASGYRAGPRSCQYCACKHNRIWTP